MENLTLLQSWLVFIPTAGTALATWYLRKSTKTTVSNSEKSTRDTVDNRYIKQKEYTDKLQKTIDNLEKRIETLETTCLDVQKVCESIKKTAEEERVNYVRFSLKQSETLTDIRNVLYKNAEGKAQDVKQLDTSDLKNFGKVIIKE